MKGDPTFCHGWLVFDKPEGMRSTAAVSLLRKLFGLPKAGHAGVLDAFASGVLPVAFGEATKTMRFVMEGAKTYRFSARWGEARDTDDCTGQVVGTSKHRPDRASIEMLLPRFTGDVLQRPPDYSTVHVRGKRAHQRARNGETIRLEPRRVRVDMLRLITVGDNGSEAEFEMTCGKGVYVRAIVRDLGEALGCLGHVTRLRRLCNGCFGETQAWTLDKIEKIGDTAARCASLLPVSEGLSSFPFIRVNAAEARHLQQGKALLVPGGAPDGSTVWAAQKGWPVAICLVWNGSMHPSRVFNFPDKP